MGFLPIILIIEEEKYSLDDELLRPFSPIRKSPVEWRFLLLKIFGPKFIPTSLFQFTTKTSQQYASQDESGDI